MVKDMQAEQSYRYRKYGFSIMGGGAVLITIQYVMFGTIFKLPIPENSFFVNWLMPGFSYVVLLAGFVLFVSTYVRVKS